MVIDKGDFRPYLSDSVRVRLAVAALLLFSASPALSAEPLAGTASVIDGDTLEIHGQRIRLHGIDAPESQQLCQDGAGKDWRCGQKAALALSDRIARRPVTCEVKDTDRYGRSVAAQCSRRVGGGAGEDLSLPETPARRG